ncbi:MAG: VWA domain-containing protein [Spirochaetes bacterium]|nr:VWA domain-containing protein [Spirochaetota bacterium]
MKVRPKFISLLIIIMLLFSISIINGAENEKDVIQMAILLDTSGSMEGLIQQAKSQLWKIVNEFALAKRKDQSPNLEVALYEYGKSSISAKEGYLRMIVPLTTDLDKVSEELFRLTTNGGEEYCGEVIQSAIKGLKWSKNNNILKIIFIAGNEPFTQGQVDYKKSCKNAISKGVIVNTIFCGDYNVGINTQWKHGADLADGKYINIDHNQQIVDIKAPQDKEIIKLGKELNKTYLSYGKEGKKYKLRQLEQDKNALSMSNETIVQRSITKSSKQYSNKKWDLVDALEEGEVSIENMKDEDLPEEMKGMTKKERKEYVEKQIKKRKEIQEKINKLNEDRRKYVEKEMKKQTEENTLDSAIINSIRKQASKKNYEFK